MILVFDLEGNYILSKTLLIHHNYSSVNGNSFQLRCHNVTVTVCLMRDADPQCEDHHATFLSSFSSFIQVILSGMNSFRLTSVLCLRHVGGLRDRAKLNTVPLR